MGELKAVLFGAAIVAFGACERPGGVSEMNGNEVDRREANSERHGTAPLEEGEQQRTAAPGAAADAGQADAGARTDAGTMAPGAGTRMDGGTTVLPDAGLRR